MNMWVASVALAAGSLLNSGCVVGPNYRMPNTEVPAAYGDAGHPPTTQGATTRSSVVDQSQPPWIDWWTKFGDVELNSLVSRAATANHELKIAAARVQEARAVQRIADSRLYPTVDIGAAILKSRGSSAGFGFPYGLPGMDTNLYQIGFDATYEVDLFGGVRRSIEAAGAMAEASEDERRGVQVTLLGEVARDYIALRALQRRLAVAGANLDDQRKTLDIVRRRLKNGLTTNFDLVRANAQVAATESAIPPLEAGIRQTIHGISVLLGEPPLSLSDELSAGARDSAGASEGARRDALRIAAAPTGHPPRRTPAGRGDSRAGRCHRRTLSPPRARRNRWRAKPAPGPTV